MDNDIQDRFDAVVRAIISLKRATSRTAPEESRWADRQLRRWGHYRTALLQRAPLGPAQSLRHAGGAAVRGNGARGA